MPFIFLSSIPSIALVPWYFLSMNLMFESMLYNAFVLILCHVMAIDQYYLDLSPQSAIKLCPY